MPEVSVPAGRKRSGWMRVDVGVFRNDNLVAVVEVKAPGGRLKNVSKQRQCYEDLSRDYGIPYYVLANYDQIGSLIAKLKEG